MLKTPNHISRPSTSEKNVVCVHQEHYPVLKKQEEPVICDNMKKPRCYNVKWNKPDTLR